ncbi:MAG: hypothetical protein LKG24_06420 [Lacticaseibacillus songhuajiangensis]|jgi:hypothetical protein|nr:hypothetical protein [Lacticaseibacillus songhuajiangensis]
MKKIVLGGTILAIGLMLAGCGNSYSSNDRAKILSLKTEVKKLKRENAKLKASESANADEGSNDSASTQTSDESDSELSFGQSAPLSDSSGVNFDMEVMSAQVITDKNEGLIADLAANYSELHKFEIITYKVTALADGFDPESADGSNLTFLDSEGSRGTVSGNRDSTGEGTLNKGESATLRIGVGFEATGSKVSVRAANVTWTGDAK